jgi:hypothetical protein
LSNKLKDVIVTLDKERAKVRKLEEEVKRLRYMLMQSLVDQEQQHQADYIKHLEEGLDSSIKLNKAQAERKT